jgi:small subunit ribosomal protein S1
MDDSQRDDLTDPQEDATNNGDEKEREEFLKAMEQEFEVSRSDRGEIVTGTIVSIGSEFAFIDLGAKSEGVLSLEELRGEDGQLPQPGDQVEACVLSTGPDGIVLSKRLAKGIRSRELLEEAARTRIPVQGRVTGRNKGGFEVEVAGIRAFCPIGQIELHFCEDPDVHLGKSYSFLITKYDLSSRRPDMVLTRKALLQAEAEKQAEELRKNLKEGDVVTGTVRSVREFGAFVDLGGLEGLLHVSELSHSHVDDPKQILKEGEELHVQVISIEQGGQRIGLSLKRLEADPWDDVMLSFPVGMRTRGKVVRLEPFGAFVELAPGVDGLIHISNFNTPERITHPRTVTKIGQEVLVEVLSVDPQQRRIGLARMPKEGEFGSIPVVGDVLEGKVDSVANFGVFVTLGPGRKGLVPNVEMGTARGADHRKEFSPGTPMRVLVLEVTENGKKIRLSRKAALEAAERAEYEGYVEKDSAKSSKGFGTLGDLLNKKLKSK